LKKKRLIEEKLVDEKKRQDIEVAKRKKEQELKTQQEAEALKTQQELKKKKYHGTEKCGIL